MYGIQRTRLISSVAKSALAWLQHTVQYSYTWRTEITDMTGKNAWWRASVLNRIGWSADSTAPATASDLGQCPIRGRCQEPAAAVEVNLPTADKSLTFTFVTQKEGPTDFASHSGANGTRRNAEPNFIADYPLLPLPMLSDQTIHIK